VRKKKSKGRGPVEIIMGSVAKLPRPIRRLGKKKKARSSLVAGKANKIDSQLVCELKRKKMQIKPRRISLKKRSNSGAGMSADPRSKESNPRRDGIRSGVIGNEKTGAAAAIQLNQQGVSNTLGGLSVRVLRKVETPGHGKLRHTTRARSDIEKK